MINLTECLFPKPPHASPRPGGWRKLLPACLILGAATISHPVRAGGFATAVLGDTPVAFWQLNETGNADTGILPAADSSGNNLAGTYGTTSENAFNSISGPPNPPFLGFTANQGALQTSAGDANSPVTIPFLNLNTNVVDTTIAMWINPDQQELASAALFFQRTGSDANGFGFANAVDTTTGLTALGYTWNNTAGSYNWNSGLEPQLGVWSFVVLVVQSNQATIYMDYKDPNTGNPVLESAVNVNAQTPEAFNGGTIEIGNDVLNANRVFGGQISDVALFHGALSAQQVTALFAAGLGVAGFAPQITTQPQSIYTTTGSTVQFSASGINGTAPFTYQWNLGGSPLANNATYSGVNSNVLTIANATTLQAGTYQLVVHNTYGNATSTNVTLTIQNPALVGEWFTNSSLADVSGYSAPGTHDGYDAEGTGNYLFTNDVPTGKTGKALYLFNVDTAIAVSNSSTLDANYTSTFDQVIGDQFTVSCWSRTWPTTWSPWVSKFGETESGWQLRIFGSSDVSCFTIRDGNAGGAVKGDSGDDNGGVIPSEDGNWHLYVGTFNASTGIRTLYVDGQISGQETNDVPYTLAPSAHLVIGGKDTPPGNAFSNFSTNEIYDVRIYNYALTQSNVLALYGVVPVAINGQPQSLQAFGGSTAQFTAVVGGTPPFQFQWQLNGTNISQLADSTNFTGANSNVLTVLSASATDVGSYSLLATNLYGTGVSSNATLTLKFRHLVGQWFTGAASLADVSGYQAAGTHNGYDAAGNSAYSFVSDAPPGKSGQSLSLVGTTAIAINNSASSDAAYTNTFDDTLAGNMTIGVWAKGQPGNWNGWISKWGESPPEAGWQIREDGWGNASGGACFTVRDNSAGNVILGVPSTYGDQDDMGSTVGGADGNWHSYVGTYNQSTGIRSFYVDAVLVAQENGNVAYPLATNAHVVIGGKDSYNSTSQTWGNFGNYYSGEIYDVSIYNYDLTSNQVVTLYGPPNPEILGPVASLTGYVGGSVTMSTTVSGTAPFTNHWQLNGVNLVDGTHGGVIVSGSTTPVLKLANLTAAYQGTYQLVVSNSVNVATSSSLSLTIATTAAAPAGNLVGQWLNGTASLADTSGHSPAGTHDGYGILGTAGAVGSHFEFTNDVPINALAGVKAAGNSLWFIGNSAVVISNSSTVDANYTNTFDDGITNAFTVTVWAKGLPGGWNPFVSKYGDNTVGWQSRVDGNLNPCFTVRDGGVGTDTIGQIGQAYGGLDDLASKGVNVQDGQWHFYAGTFNATTGYRNLYVDGQLVGQKTGDVVYNEAPASHVTIGAQDQSGILWASFYTGEIYGVNIYNVDLSAAQVNYVLQNTLTQPVGATYVTITPTFLPASAPGAAGKIVLSWPSGNLVESTNLAGPWTPVVGTSPYTNSETSQQMFFEVHP